MHPSRSSIVRPAFYTALSDQLELGVPARACILPTLVRDLFFATFLLAACADAPAPRTPPIPAQPAQPTASAPASPPSPPPNIAAEEVLCTVRVDAVGKQYTGKAEAAGKTADADALTRDALDRACIAMTKAEGVGCSDPQGFIKTVVNMMELTNGNMTRRAAVTLRPVKRTLEGTARAPATSGKLEVCKLALANACNVVPAETACNTRGVLCVDAGAKALACSPARTFTSSDFAKSWPLQNDFGRDGGIGLFEDD
jgi:hypothetical protein